MEEEILFFGVASHSRVYCIYVLQKATLFPQKKTMKKSLVSVLVVVVAVIKAAVIRCDSACARVSLCVGGGVPVGTEAE